MVKKIGDYQVPFDQKGNLLHYGWQNDIWQDNHPFQAEMELLDMRSGRSAKYLIWQDCQYKRQYPMFIVDLVDLAKHGSIVEGRTGLLHWTVRKRGSNFGIAVLEV